MRPSRDLLFLLNMFIACAIMFMMCASVLTQSKAAPLKPLARLTPGATNPLVTQTTIKTTICVKGWSKTQRPPATFTNKIKLQVMAAYGIRGNPADYEGDHLISIELGGLPGGPLLAQNFWPELWTGAYGARTKDKLENALHRDVCAGKIKLLDAQALLATDWIGAYKARFEKP